MPATNSRAGKHHGRARLHEKSLGSAGYACQHWRHAGTGFCAAAAAAAAGPAAGLVVVCHCGQTAAHRAGKSGAVLSAAAACCSPHVGAPDLCVFCPGLAGPRLALARANQLGTAAASVNRCSSGVAGQRAAGDFFAAFCWAGCRLGRSCAANAPGFHHDLHRPVEPADGPLDFARSPALWAFAFVWPD